MSSWTTILYDALVWPDSIGPSPSLSHKGKSRFKTLLGSFLTISLIIICFLTNILELQDTLYGWGPSIDTIEYRTCCDQDFNYNVTSALKLHFQFEYYNESSNTIQTINKEDLPNISISMFYNGVEGRLPNSPNENSYLVGCTSDVFANYSLYYDFFSSQEYVPRDHENLTYNYDTYGNHSYALSEIKSIQDKSLCFPPYFNEKLINSLSILQTIGFKLDNNQMSILKSKYNTPLLYFTINSHKSFLVNPKFNDTLKSDPLIMEMVYSRIKIDFNTYHQYDVSLEKKEVSLNKDFFLLSFGGKFSNLTNYIFFKEIGNIDNTVDIPIKDMKNQTNLIFVNFVMSAYTLEYYIDYKKIENVLSNIGGLLGLFFPIFEWVCGLIVSTSYDASRLNSVFNFHENWESQESIEHLMDTFINSHVKSGSRNNIDKVNIIGNESNASNLVELKRLDKASKDNFILKSK